MTKAKHFRNELALVIRHIGQTSNNQRL